MMVPFLWCIGVLTFGRFGHVVSSGGGRTGEDNDWEWIALGRVERSLSDICTSSSKQRCYDDLGCFPCHKKFHAQSPEKIDMVFYLHTDSNTTNQTIFYSNFSSAIGNIRIDSSKKLWVIIHGYEGQWPLPWIGLMTTALLSKGNNVLIARWTKGTSYPYNYFQACSNGRVVGAMIGRLLKELRKKNKVNFQKTSLIGFSLGVPVAGYAGAFLNGTVKQIVGLDPAGAGYEGADPKDRLDKDDAQMVQCIHTHGAPMSHGGLGTMQPMGDIDFYVNGGVQQPGCPVTSRTDFSIEKFYNIIEVVGCNHLRAPALFTDSIWNSDGDCKYKAYPCDSEKVWFKGTCFSCSQGCPLMGYPLDPETDLRGKFFLSTTLSQGIREGNYCGKNFRVSLVPDRDVRGEIKVVLRNGLQSAKRSTFQKKSEVLPSHGRSVILAAPFDEVTSIKIFYDRYNILVSKSVEIFALKMVTASTDTGEKFGSNCTVRVEDDGATEVELYKGIGYSNAVIEGTVLNLTNRSFCAGHYVSSSNRGFCSFCLQIATVLLLSVLLSGRF